MSPFGCSGLSSPHPRLPPRCWLLSWPPVPPRPDPGEHTHLRSFCLLQFEIRQLRAHLAQQDLDLAAEREAALQAPHMLSQPRSRYKVVEAGTWAEETAADSIVEELRPSQGECAVARAPRSPTSPHSPGLCTERLGHGIPRAGATCGLCLVMCVDTPKLVPSQLPLRAQEEHLAGDLTQIKKYSDLVKPF